MESSAPRKRPALAGDHEAPTERTRRATRTEHLSRAELVFARSPSRTHDLCTHELVAAEEERVEGDVPRPKAREPLVETTQALRTHDSLDAGRQRTACSATTTRSPQRLQPHFDNFGGAHGDGREHAREAANRALSG